MEPQTAHAHAEILYEPDERPPFALGVGLGFQYTLVIVAGIVLTPVIMIRAAGGGEAYLSWAVFAALVICGLTTVVQALRGRAGRGRAVAAAAALLRLVGAPPAAPRHRRAHRPRGAARPVLTARASAHRATDMKKTLKSNEKSRGVTPASVLLNRLIGPSPAPRMLTPEGMQSARNKSAEV